MTQLFKQLSVTDAFEMINNQSVTIIDIRDPQSFETGHIPDAVRIDNQNVYQFLTEAKKDLPLIVCCYHGNSSQPAAQYFAEEGFQSAHSLMGGFTQWQIQYPENVEVN